MKIKAMIFDMDGVLTSSSDEHFAAWRVLASELGFELPDELEVLTKGISRMDSLEVILKYGHMQDKYTYEQKKEMAEKKNAIYVEMISGYTPENLLPGAAELLEECTCRNIKVALASASRNGPLLMERLAISHYFDYVVNPMDIARGKPAPDIFLKAALEFDLAPKFCVGLEDSIAGITSIKLAGMTAVGIGNPGELSEADIVYPDCSRVKLLEINELVI